MGFAAAMFSCVGLGRGAGRSVSPPPRSPSSEEEETEEAELSDTSSILSDDSVYPCYEPAPAADGGQVLTFYQCCARNNAKLLQETLARGVSREEVTELDINGRNGLVVACFKGFVDIVTLLSKCPYIDINHQDNDGNTALMIAAQAGRSCGVPVLELHTGAPQSTRAWNAH
uniref:Uncharacterized protein n=1 Tax=Chrysemys picta bellii TaxID=8478 RepID=A0A8C3I2S1_CHRPI